MKNYIFLGKNAKNRNGIINREDIKKLRFKIIVYITLTIGLLYSSLVLSVEIQNNTLDNILKDTEEA